ncbi:MAG TPA: triose-phosphate isomerase [Rhizomicrobium sp.]|nr:triose-phosphate isomerase [Rhizomicrobium sp.]
MQMKPLIAGNWKMNGLSGNLREVELIAAAAGSIPHADILICPPATLVARAAQVTGGRIAIGGQDCHPEAWGAFTGDISAEMLRDSGAQAVIVGHSERRQCHGETSELVARKAQAAWRAGLLAIICVGESESERSAGHHLNVCELQIAQSVPVGARAGTTAVAYEPVWAIGTGRTASRDDIAAMHVHIRKCLLNLSESTKAVRILYGGSVKPANAAEILRTDEVGGALVGGASLMADEFCRIAEAAFERP